MTNSRTKSNFEFISEKRTGEETKKTEVNIKFNIFLNAVDVFNQFKTLAFKKCNAILKIPAWMLTHS